MMTSTDTRRKAREALAGKWGKGALMTLTYVLLYIFLSFIERIFKNSDIITLVAEILIYIIEIPISYGFIVSFIKLKRNEEVEVFDFLKYGFNNFGRSWGILGNTLVKMILPIVLIIISLIIIDNTVGISVIQAFTRGTEVSFSFLAIIGIVLYFVAIIYAIAKGLLYSLSKYIAYDNAEMSTKEAVEESARLMKGKRGSLFCLELSFILYALSLLFIVYQVLSLLFLKFLTNNLSYDLLLVLLYVSIATLPFLFIIPYLQVSLVCFYEEVSQNKESNETEINLKK